MGDTESKADEEDDEVEAASLSSAWEQLRRSQKFELSPLRVHKVRGAPPPKLPGTTRFVCVSDTHNKHDKIELPEGDVLLHAGDFSGHGDEKEILAFIEWVARVKERFSRVVVIAGNHEIGMDPAVNARKHRVSVEEATATHKQLREKLSEHCVYLEHEAARVAGFTIFGSPYTPMFCNWAFNVPRGRALRRLWEDIPRETDILITHGPPLGRGDECFRGGRAGCLDLLHAVQRNVKPRLHVFGHIHEGSGHVTFDGTTTFVNASTCTLMYRPSNPPVVVDLPNKQ